MSESDVHSDIVHHLVGTAKAHHEATGGVNPRWARWYAERLIDDLNEALQSDMDLDELEQWLIEADRRYRAEPQTESWPKVYARWLIAEQGLTH